VEVELGGSRKLVFIYIKFSLVKISRYADNKEMTNYTLSLGYTSSLKPPCLLF